MIFELEVLMREVDFYDKLNFPDILIVRRKKKGDKVKIANNEELLIKIKQGLKDS